jgi:release factor glutamine methyltransferase
MTVFEAERILLSLMSQYYHSRHDVSHVSSTIIDHITGTTFKDRVGDKTTLISSAQKEIFDKYIAELQAGKPYEYVLNKININDLELYVDENVTIPQWETVGMVDCALESISYEYRDSSYKEKELTIIDIGTGAGLIAISLKKHLPASRVYACDISGKALQVARRNAATHGVEIEFIHADFLDPNTWNKFPAADLILCNPPYVPKQDKETLKQIERMYEPYEGLFINNDDQLVFYKAIVAFAMKKLLPSAYLFLQTHGNLDLELVNLLKISGFWVYNYDEGYLGNPVIRACFPRAYNESN